MLSAQKALLQATVQEGGAQLQAQELSYLGSNFSTISTMASVIAGFAFSGLLISTSFTGVHGSKWTQTVTNLYYFFAALAIGACLMTCVISTTISVRGTGLALRGPDGSLKKAVVAMRAWQRAALITLSVGVVSFHLQGMSYAWLELTLTSNVVVVTVVLGSVLVLMLHVIFSVYNSLAFVDSEYQAGDLTHDQLTSIVRRLGGGAPPDATAATPNYGATEEKKTIETGILEPPAGATELPEPAGTDSSFVSLISSVIYGSSLLGDSSGPDGDGSGDGGTRPPSSSKSLPA